MSERTPLTRGDILRLSAAAIFLAAALAAALAPDAVMNVVGARMRFASTSIQFSYGLACLLGALAIALGSERHAPIRAGAVAALGLSAVWFWTQGFAHWWIDDAGVTFAYARSLAEGAGLTFYPGRPAEEGYSSTLWMALLAGAASLGAAIPAAAKVMGVAFSGAALLASAGVLAREVDRGAPLAILLLFAAGATAPVIIWSASGQEHALQGLLLTGAAILAWRGGARWRVWVGLTLVALVLTRPEAPLIVIAAFLAAVMIGWREEGGWRLRRDLPVALIPFAAFCGLMAFRALYFGDLFPNPFYAKAGSNTLSGLFNPFGGGWGYVFEGLAITALLILLPFVALMRWADASPARQRLLMMGFALLASHLAFVVWARGDWMAQFRFLAPIIPLFALIAVIGAAEAVKGGRRTVLLGAMALVLAQSTILDMVNFRGRPTTPMKDVTVVGDHFAALASRMGIEGATLAHHDAGGIAYHRRIELIDLGGLVDRTIAKNMTDANALGAYLFDERKPTFIVGARNFAARSGVFERPAFARDYVRLEFEDRRIKQRYRHIRRDAVRAAPGVEIIREGGEIVEVRVR